MSKADEKVDAGKAELKGGADKVKESAGQAVTAVGDTTITAGVKAKLATDSDLKTLDIRPPCAARHLMPLRRRAPRSWRRPSAA